MSWLKYKRNTVLPAKSDSDVMFYLQSYQGLRIDKSLVYESYPVDRINTQVVYRFALAQVNDLLNNCKQNTTSLSLLAGRTVAAPSVNLVWLKYKRNTVLPAKIDSDVMFCLQSYQGLKSIDHLCINPIRRIG